MTRPEVFLDLEIDAALAEASAAKKWLLVDATASWCGPCQVMDRTTWVDPAVVGALRERAIAIQLDVDAKPDVAERLRIKAMPTVIAFHEGVEVDRVTGLQKREQLLGWLDGLARGETSLDASRASVASEPADMHARIAHARKLLNAGHLDDATAEYVWLWEHMLEHDPAMYGVRLSFLVSDLKELVRSHRGAREAFARLRESVKPASDETPDWERLRDWFALNEVLEEEAASVAWFDERGPQLQVDDRVARQLELKLVPLLVDAGRWAAVGALYRNPLATLERAAEIRDHTTTRLPTDAVPPEMARQLRSFGEDRFRETARVLVRALRAANRHQDAVAVCEAAKKHDPSAEMSRAISEAEGAEEPGGDPS